METYLILRDNAGPWELVRHLFPLVPIKSIHPSVLPKRGSPHQYYEIDSNRLTQLQSEALIAALLWQREDDKEMNFERAASEVKYRFLISKHWVDHVYSESLNGVIVSSEDLVDAVY